MKSKSHIQKEKSWKEVSKDQKVNSWWGEVRKDWNKGFEENEALKLSLKQKMGNKTKKDFLVDVGSQVYLDNILAEAWLLVNITVILFLDKGMHGNNVQYAIYLFPNSLMESSLFRWMRYIPVLT